MTPKRFMLIAGEASGDMLAAELVKELRAGMMRRFTYSPNAQPLDADLAPRFFGAGGPRMAAAGVELAVDMTQHSLTGLPSPREYLKFRRLLHQMVALACEREPHVIICVDFSVFNSTFAAAVAKYVRQRRGTFNNWQPKLVKYISPQVWASRANRAYAIARDFDLLLSIFPFEKDWYAARVPKLRVEFIGHPIIERYQDVTQLPAMPSQPVFSSLSTQPAPKAFGVGGESPARPDGSPSPGGENAAQQISRIEPPNRAFAPLSAPFLGRGEGWGEVRVPVDGEGLRDKILVLLPGSRQRELDRHLPVILSALKIIQAAIPNVRSVMALPSDELVTLAKAHPLAQGLEIRCGALAETFASADVAIASTGTVTMECAYFRVPTVTLYKAFGLAWGFRLGIITSKWLTMPNILANGEIFPEFLAGAATPENIARAALELLHDPARREKIQSQLAKIIASLGPPGASRRAADLILEAINQAQAV